MATPLLPSTLTDAIEKAVETHKEELAKIPQDLSGPPAAEEPKEEKEKKEEKKEEPKTEPDLDAENGKVLIQALRDPEKAGMVIDYLAKQAGYTKATVETKKEAKTAAKDITEILENNLGDEFKFLAPKLAPAIKEAMESLIATHTDNSDLRERVERQEMREIEKETQSAHAELSQEYFQADDMPDNVIKAMSAAMDEFPPSAQMQPKVYYRKIFHLVAGELGLSKKVQTKEQTDKAARNRGDAAVRELTSQNRGVTPDVSEGSPKKMTLDEAVKTSLKQVETAMNKK